MMCRPKGVSTRKCSPARGEVQAWGSPGSDERCSQTSSSRPPRHCWMLVPLQVSTSPVQAAPTFELTLNRPVRFAAYTSNRRAQDTPGDLVPLDRRAFHPLPPLQTTIVQDDANFSARKTAAGSVAVLLETGITEGLSVTPYYDPMIAKIVQTAKQIVNA